MPTELYLPTPGERWIDTDAGNTPPGFAAAIKAQGYGGIIWDLYNAHPADLDQTLAAGLGVMLVQGYDPAAWSQPRQAKIRAKEAQTHAQALGYRRGATLWLDFEDCELPSATISPWINTWAIAIRASGYPPGGYLGEPELLTGAEAYALLCQHYWQGSSAIPAIPIRGYQIVQGPWDQAITVSGVSIPFDVDTIQKDGRGDLPIAMRATPSTTGHPSIAMVSVPVNALTALQATTTTLAAQVAALTKED